MGLSVALLAVKQTYPRLDSVALRWVNISLRVKEQCCSWCNSRKLSLALSMSPRLYWDNTWMIMMLFHM